MVWDLKNGIVYFYGGQAGILTLLGDLWSLDVEHGGGIGWTSILPDSEIPPMHGEKDVMYFMFNHTQTPGRRNLGQTWGISTRMLFMFGERNAVSDFLGDLWMIDMESLSWA
jgi:hypothetical protein